MELQRRLRVFLITWEHPYCTAGSRLKIYSVPSKAVAKVAVFRELRGLNVKLLFSNPENAHPCAEPRRLTYFAWKSVQRPGLWVVGRTRGKRKPNNLWCAIISRIRGKETPWWIVTKFCMLVDIRDVITYTTFGDDRLWGLGVTSPISPLHCVVALTSYNSRTTVRVCKKSVMMW